MMVSATEVRSVDYFRAKVTTAGMEYVPPSECGAYALQSKEGVEEKIAHAVSTQRRMPVSATQGKIP